MGFKATNAFVQVRDNNIDQALRVLKKKLQREGVFREMRLKQHFEKPSEKTAREKSEAIRRTRKNRLKKEAKDIGMTVVEYKAYKKKNMPR